ncbi:MAG: hypothetical protein DSZ03_00675, partial [Sulfurimonas sp.]
SDTKVLTGLFEEYEKAGGYRYKAKVDEVLQGIGVYGLKDSFVNEISGGELRRVFLARVLVSDPDLFLFDEPTNHLDLFAVKWFENFLKNCKNAFILVSHDPNKFTSSSCSYPVTRYGGAFRGGFSKQGFNRFQTLLCDDGLPSIIAYSIGKGI